MRWVLTKGKLPAASWIEVITTAHEVGLRSSSTMMYGHVDNPTHWVGHLRTLARIQDQTGGFTEFVPLPFIHTNAPLYLAGVARPGPTVQENRAVHAIARIMLHGRIDNVQCSWVKLGVDGCRDVLRGGVNDLGGTLMEETISRMAGSEHGSAKTVADLHAIVDGLPGPPRPPAHDDLRPGRPTSGSPRPSTTTAPCPASPARGCCRCGRLSDDGRPPNAARRSTTGAVERLRASYAAIPAGQPSGWPSARPTCSGPRTAERGRRARRQRARPASSRSTSTARTADVQGMCTYETLVAATLPHGLMPLVVPQLKTITLGGAVTGLGIESSSFRNGLPHESVLELDILTGAGELVTASRTENADLFRAFPNSYGSLGYAVRLRIELEPVQPYVGLRHVQFTDLDELCAAIATINATRRWINEPVDFLDGVDVRARRRLPDPRPVLRHGRPRPASTRPSDYTGQQIYYRSLRTHSKDCLTIARLPLALGHRLVLVLGGVRRAAPGRAAALAGEVPAQRRLSPHRRLREPLPRRRPHRPAGAGGPTASGSCRTSRSRSSRPRTSCAGSPTNVPMSPVWLCPISLREPAATAATVAAVPDAAGQLLRQRRLLGHRPDRGRARRR